MISRTIVPVAAVDCEVVVASWPFAVDQAEAIDRHWRRRLGETPDLFNGRVLLLQHGAVHRTSEDRDVFRGGCIEADFKDFLAWREFGFPETGMRNCFAMAAIETADGAFVLGEMGPQTATAGQIYFPSGTPDRHDIKGNRVDIEGSAARELQEETGLGRDDVSFEPGMILVIDPIRVCCMKRVRSPETAERLVERIHAWLSQDPKPELSRMHIVRHPLDITPAMPDFVATYLRWMFNRR